MSLSQVEQDDTLGIYVHVPFCERVCPYCDFAVLAARNLSDEQEQCYRDALLAELLQRSPDFEGLELASLYFGGGTPSLMQPGSIERIVSAAFEHFAPAAELEITLEVNPSTVERERIPDFLAAGVNRLSVGIQSFDDTALRKLGRAHRSDECHATLRAARDAGCENLSLDLIFAAPGQRLPGLERDLEQALEYAPEHLSSYALTVEEGTPFATAAARGQLDVADEEEVVAMLECIESRLADAGLRRYEISNYALLGSEAVHNRRYWDRQAILGLGVGAWSTELPSALAPHAARRSNRRDLVGYLERVATGKSTVDGETEILSPATARGEAMFLGLRTVWGVDAAAYEAEFGGSPRTFFSSVIEEFVLAGLLCEESSGDLTLTARGRLISDSVFERFVLGEELGSPR